MKTLKFNIVFAMLMTLCSITAAGQDLLARQAPIDAKLKMIDSISIRRMLMGERNESPAASLYGAWNEKYTRQRENMPDSFLIKLNNFCMPTESRIVMSDFGLRNGRQHKGLDIKVYTGDTIRSAFSGKVRIVRFDNKGFGNYVVIRHHNGLETIYGHMSKNLVTQNQEVEAGTPIGLGGSSGRSTSAHLHFETRLCGIAIDPALLFDFRNQDVTGDYYMYCHNATEKGKTQVAQQSKQKDEQNTAVRYHKVVRGETLSSIARKHHTTVSNLCRINRISTSYRLKPGQILKYN